MKKERAIEIKGTDPEFQPGQKVWDKFAGKTGVIVSQANDYYYNVDEGPAIGTVLCCAADLQDFYTAKTFRGGQVVMVKDVFDEPIPSVKDSI